MDRKIFFLILALFCIVSLGTNDINAQSASPSDVKQANQFISSLPPACKNSSMTTKADGAVAIRILCEGNGQSSDGLIEIKNGVVTKIR